MNYTGIPVGADVASQDGYMGCTDVNFDTDVACWDEHVNYTGDLVGADVACFLLGSYERYGQLYYIRCI